MNETLKRILKPVASLRLTVALLGASMVVIFAGTLAQRDAGIWQVQKQLFHSWVTWIDLRNLIFVHVSGSVPFIGGSALIVLLLINLLAAHLVRFKLTWKRTGIILIHAGLILLLLGEMITYGFASEGQMTLNRGDALNYTQDIRGYELAVTDRSAGGQENVTVIPSRRLARKGSVISDPQLPFEVQVEDYYPNSQLLGPMQEGPKADPRVNAGDQVGRRIVPIPQFSGAGEDASKVDIPVAILTLKKGNQSLGTWLASPWATAPQTVSLPEGKSVQLDLRFKRVYKPYTVQLLKFTHDTYIGSELDSNFASRVRLVDPSRHVDREVVIWMNHPLRYAGETFYQQSFGPDGHGSEFTQLQIVHNPGWLIPYIALAIALVGLVLQFGGHLITFLRRELKAGGSRARFAGALIGHLAGGQIGFVAGAAAVAAAQRRGARKSKPPGEVVIPARTSAFMRWVEVALPATVTIACAIFVILASRAPAEDRAIFDIAGFSKLPVSYEGRTMPLDTLARTALKILHSSESITLAGESVPADRWLIDVMSHSDRADRYESFRIDNTDVLSAIGLDASRKYFSMSELLDHKKALQPQVDKAFHAKQAGTLENSDVVEQKFYELGLHLMLYIKVQELASLYLVPPLDHKSEWQTVAQGVKSMEQTGSAPNALQSLMGILDAYRADKPDEFNADLAGYRTLLTERLPAQKTIDFEAFFNRFDPFQLCIDLYVIVFLLAIGSWLGMRRALSRAALCVLALTLIVHSFGLISRMYISGRPPVINLYSSAIFIAWGAVVLSLGLEIIYGGGVGCAVGAVIGFCSLLIAQSLSMEGDTMAQLRAVLDTNFWLATHVVVITLGYAATFLAGILGVVFIAGSIGLAALGGILRQVAPSRNWLVAEELTSFTSEAQRVMARMIYGIVCFGLLFSFVGTILGGIWADQSWGRFWGWDPKENGAILIVLWNAVILHARWGGLVRAAGLAVLAVFGNVVTSWSWFGTNMLGVGLHSYGFMDKAFPLLIGFDLIQLAVIVAGVILALTKWGTAPQPAKAGVMRAVSLGGARVTTA